MFVGAVFGRYRIVAGAQSDNRNRRRWLCQCVCGQRKIVRTDNLTGGLCRSCGCLSREMSIQRGLKHGYLRSGNRKSRTYSSWQAMKQRCYNRNSDNFESYGGRGITVCDRWRDDFAAFLADMDERPAEMTLDRIDSTGNYEPSNCRWAMVAVQNRHQRSRLEPYCKRGHPWTMETTYISPKGRRRCLTCKRQLQQVAGR